jgi:AcrR family transcriptional regulator
MTTRCRACTHPRRAELEASLRSGVSVRQVAVRFGVSRSTLDRHMGNGHAIASVALSGDVEVIQDVPTYRDPVAQVEALKEATLSSFNLMRRRGDDPVAIAYLKEFRALVALEMDIADRRGGKDHDHLDAMRQKIASENRQYLTAVEERRALDAIKAKLVAHLADRRAEATAPAIDLAPAPHPPVISVKNAPPVSPVRKRTRRIPAKI